MSESTEVLQTMPEKTQKVPLTETEKLEKKKEKKHLELISNEEKIEQLLQIITESKEEIKKLKKRNRKLSPKKKVTTSGITKQVPISKDLAKYLGVKPTTLVARSEVSKLLSQIFDKKGIKNGQLINVASDKSTLKLFGPAIYPVKSSEPETLGYSWQNIQKYLTEHFPKSEKKETTSVVV